MPCALAFFPQSRRVSRETSRITQGRTRPDLVQTRLEHCYQAAEPQCSEKRKRVEEGFTRQFLLRPHTNAVLITLDCASTQVFPE